MPPPSNTQKDFEAIFKENDLVVFRSPTLSNVNIERKHLINALKNILQKSNINIEQIED